MKKYKIIIAVITFICNAATAQVGDTTAYLRDTIVGKKSYYIGKPLSVLLLDLKIQPIIGNTFVYYVPAMEKDTVNLARIDFYFEDFITQIQRNPRIPGVGSGINIDSKSLLVRFTPVKTPCIFFKPGNVLSFLSPWSDQMKMYFMQPAMVVADISSY